MRWIPSLVLLTALTNVGAAADTKKITYDEHILPIFRDKCLSCHNPDKARGDLDLAQYARAMAGGSSGEVIKPGDPESSPLFGTVSHKVEPKMPPNGSKLADEQLNLIRQWIEQGALENAGSKAPLMKPKVNIALAAPSRGKPEGPPPMPSAKLAQDPLVTPVRGTAVTAITASPWAPLVAVAGPKQVALYHADSLDLLGVLPFPAGVPHVLKFSRNGQLLLAGGGRGGHSGKVVVWNVLTGETITEVGDERDAVLAADISPDQTMIALGGPSKMIRIYSTADGSLIREIKKHTDWLSTLEFSPDGVLLATADRSSGLLVWEANTGREFYSLRGHTAAITDLSWRPDSNMLATVSEDGTLRLWEMENGNQVKSVPVHGGGALAVRYAMDGRIVTAGRDGKAKLWDGGGTLQKEFPPPGDLALRVTINHDNTRVFCGNWLGQVAVWSTADATPLGTISGTPPTVAQRLELLVKDVAIQQAAADQAIATHKNADAAAQKANAELAAAQKAVTDTAAAAKAAEAAVPVAQTALEQATAALAPLQKAAAEKDAANKAVVDAAAKVQAAVAALAGNTDLAAAGAKAKEAATKSAAELATAQKAVSDQQAVVKTMTDLFAAAQKAMADTAAAAKAAPAQVPPREQAAKAAAEALAKAKAAADEATKSLETAKAALERLKAVATVAKN